MENQNLSISSGSTTSAKDFFLHLGAMAAIYAVAISFINLVFKVIDKVYPEITQYYYNSSSQISLPVATLIIVFPIFVLLSWLVYKSYVTDPSKKLLAVRRWLTYITLFVAGIILVGDLVYILYKFLDGQNITTSFILKALSIVVVAGAVFGYYLQDIRDRVTSGGRKVWTIVSALIILVAIIIGFSVIGSPATQRSMKQDDQKVLDLQNIQWQVVSYYQRTGVLPANLTAIADPISGYVVPKDAETGLEYEYKKKGNLSFELCANFNLDSTSTYNSQLMATKPVMVDGNVSENWSHKAGAQCFARTIDSKLYPVYPTDKVVR